MNDKDKIEDAQISEVVETHTMPMQAPAEAPMPAAPQEGGMMAMIERIAASPDIDIDRMEKLLEMRAAEEARQRAIQKEDEADAARKAFLRDFAKVQAEIGPIVKNKANNHTKSRYATLAAIDEVVTPVLTKHGFSTSAMTNPSELESHINITLIIGHKDGHERTYSDDFPLDLAGSGGNTNKTRLQAIGSTKTYGRRYLKCEALDLSFEEDNDGNATSKAKTIGTDEYIEITDLISTMDPDGDRGLEGLILNAERVKALEEITMDRHPVVIRQLKTTAKKWEVDLGGDNG